jgi:uncharacterized protein (TIGR02147 family)
MKPSNSTLENSNPQQFRLFLQQELLRRCEKNRSYSLRAFARSLDINVATLSTILSGKRAITARTIEKLGGLLELNPGEIQNFCAALKPDSEVLETAEPNYLQLALDTFIAVSDWYHDAILELTHLRSFRPQPSWIAKVLGISVNEVNVAVERLVRLKLLSTESKTWRDLSHANEIGTGPLETSSALRKYQRQILELSLQSLEGTSRENRDHTSTTLTMRQKDLPEIKKLIRKFRKQVALTLRRNKTEHDQVYQLAVSIFPLTKI